MRTTGGGGQYRYGKGATRFSGHYGFGAVLLGYQAQLGELTLKGFAGISSAGHVVVPFDPDNAAIGSRTGGAVMLEAWYNYSDDIWISADAGYATLHGGFDAVLRAGHRILPAISLGVELAVTGYAEYGAVQAAALLRHTWSYGEIRASFGGNRNRDGAVKPYAALTLSLTY